MRAPGGREHPHHERNEPSGKNGACEQRPTRRLDRLASDRLERLLDLGRKDIRRGSGPGKYGCADEIGDQHYPPEREHPSEHLARTLGHQGHDGRQRVLCE